jgi:hypothetical protein
MARPAAGIVDQYAFESTRYTGTAAVKKFAAMRFMFTPQTQADFFRRAGSLFPTAGVGHRAWSAGRGDGILSYEEAPLLIASYFAPATITNPATGAYQWAFSPSSTPADLFKTMTMKRGDSTAAWSVVGAAVTSLNLDFGTDRIGVTCDVVGKAVDNTATLDAVTTTIPEAPVSIADVKWYIDTAPGSLGGTQWTKVLSATLSLPTNKQPRFVQDGTPTFDDLIETPMEDARLTIRAENGSQARGIYDACYTDSRPFRFIRCNADGDIIASTTSQRFRGDFAVKLESVNEIDNVQETYALEFNFRIMHNDTWGKALAFTGINTQSGL